MGTLEGFPNPPALWLRRAKPASAYAGPTWELSKGSQTLGPSPPNLPTARFARPRALWLRRAKPASAYAGLGLGSDGQLFPGRDRESRCASQSRPSHPLASPLCWLQCLRGRGHWFLRPVRNDRGPARALLPRLRHADRGRRSVRWMSASAFSLRSGIRGACLWGRADPGTPALQARWTPPFGATAGGQRGATLGRSRRAGGRDGLSRATSPSAITQAGLQPSVRAPARGRP